MGMLGFASGMAQGLNSVIDNRQAQDWALKTEQLRQQAEMAKEKRIEEGQIRSEQRAMANHNAQRQSDLDFSVNNADKITQIEMAKKAAQDKYSDSRFPTDLEHERQLQNVKDPLGLEKDRAQLELTRAQTDYVKNGKGKSGSNSGVNERLKVLKTEFDMLNDRIQQYDEKDPAAIQMKKRMGEISNEISSLSRSFGIDPASINSNPVGLNPEIESIKKEIMSITNGDINTDQMNFTNVEDARAFRDQIKKERGVTDKSGKDSGGLLSQAKGLANDAGSWLADKALEAKEGKTKNDSVQFMTEKQQQWFKALSPEERTQFLKMNKDEQQKILSKVG